MAEVGSSSILVACSRSPSCPVTVTERFLLTGRHHKFDYLFRKVCHTKHGFSLRPQPLTYSRASELIRKQLKAIGLNPKQYGLHSLRSGGAYAAAAAAIPDRLLMGHAGCFLPYEQQLSPPTQPSASLYASSTPW